VSLLNGYTFNNAHQFFSSVATTQGTDQRITGGAPTVTNGTFASTGVLTWTAITGSQVTNFVIYRHNSGASTGWRLVAFFDTSVTGLPVTPNGGNITLTWNASGIFTICDRNLKRDIRHVGQFVTVGLDVCRFKYEWDIVERIGFIAQDVEKKLPAAVASVEGIKVVDVAKVLATSEPRREVNWGDGWECNT